MQYKLGINTIPQSVNSLFQGLQGHLGPPN